MDGDAGMNLILFIFSPVFIVISYKDLKYKTGIPWKYNDICNFWGWILIAL